MKTKQKFNVPYFLQNSLGLKLNPVTIWTRVNLPIHIEEFKVFLSLNLNQGDYGPWN